MSERLISVLTLLAAIGSGLMAGLFFAFSISVMAALGRLTPAAGITAMQQVNIVIQNPVFFLAFFGTALLGVVLAVVALMGSAGDGSAWLVAGAVLYLVGTMVVTIVFNVPMNEALAAVDPASAEGTRLWADYLSRWTLWNHVRTVTGALALAAYVMAMR